MPVSGPGSSSSSYPATYGDDGIMQDEVGDGSGVGVDSDASVQQFAEDALNS